MTRDRLPALKAARRKEEEFDEEFKIDSPAGGSNYMEEFFEQVHEIRSEIDIIANNVKQVKQKHSAILSNPMNDQKTKKEFEELMGQIQKTASKVRSKLKLIQEQIELCESRKQNEETNLRIRRTQYNMMTRKFIEVMTDYNYAQMVYRERCKERIQRQLDIAGKHVDNEQLEEMIESGNPEIFTQGIITDTQLAKQTLADVEARHSDIAKLEKSVRELHCLFMDMVMLVESQGEIINRIENNVGLAKGYIDKAVKTTKMAVKFRSKTLKKQTVVIMLFALMIVIIVMIVSHVGNGPVLNKTLHRSPPKKTRYK